MRRKPRLVRGQDYVIDDDGSWEFTRDYLLKLKHCCKNNCRYCPYREPAVPKAIEHRPHQAAGTTFPTQVSPE